MSYHGLFIPSGDSLMEVLHSDLPIDAEAYVRTKANEDQKELRVLHFPIDVDGSRDCDLYFINDRIDPNSRAREVVSMLTGVHIVVTGPAVLLGLTGERTVEIMRALD